MSAVRGTPSQVALIRLLVLLDPQTISAHPVQAPVLNPAAQTRTLLAFPVDGIHSLHLSHPHARLAPLVTFKTTPTPKNASLVSNAPVAQSKTLISADHVQGDSYAQLALTAPMSGQLQTQLVFSTEVGRPVPTLVQLQVLLAFNTHKDHFCPVRDMSAPVPCRDGTLNETLGWTLNSPRQSCAA